MAYWDQNGNGSIDYNDGWSAEDIDNINYYCDYNGDGMTDVCEVHQCIVDYENSWRDENCPGAEHIECTCPYYSNECPGAWTCDDIYYITADVMAYWDQNGNGAIDYEDGWNAEDVDSINYYCDYNGDGMTDTCEVHQCILDYENSWRAENCPEGHPALECECPFGVVTCEGAWTCDDIYYITVDAMNYWDSNGDGQIDYNDGWNQEDVDNINYYCDYNGSGATDACEVH
jgi:hypothetical protein